jgi:hypothetical protein
MQGELDTARYCSLVDDLMCSSTSEVVKCIVLAEFQKVDPDQLLTSHDPCAIINSVDTFKHTYILNSYRLKHHIRR